MAGMVSFRKEEYRRRDDGLEDDVDAERDEGNVEDGEGKLVNGSDAVGGVSSKGTVKVKQVSMIVVADGIATSSTFNFQPLERAKVWVN